MHALMVASNHLDIELKAWQELLGPSAPQFFDAMLHSNLKILDAAETLIEGIDVANKARSLLISAVQSQRRAIFAFS